MPFDFSPFDAVLLDLDGTIYHEEHALAGAAQLVARLRAGARPFACLSNSTLSPSQIESRLARLGIPIDAAHIYPAAQAACDYVLARHGSRPRVFNLANDGIDELLEGKVEWVSKPSEPCDAVITGAITNVYATEDRQRIALSLLRNGAELVGICADRVYPSPRGLEFGVGALCAMLGYAAGVTPTFCGKPLPVFFRSLCDRLGVAPERCVLVGDNLEADIDGGRGVGMRTVLVLTGVATREDVARLPEGRRPDWVVATLLDLL